jgi:hypothetical protein
MTANGESWEELEWMRRRNHPPRPFCHKPLIRVLLRKIVLVAVLHNLQRGVVDYRILRHPPQPPIRTFDTQADAAVTSIDDHRPTMCGPPPPPRAGTGTTAAGVAAATTGAPGDHRQPSRHHRAYPGRAHCRAGPQCHRGDHTGRHHGARVWHARHHSIRAGLAPTARRSPSRAVRRRYQPDSPHGMDVLRSR